MNFAFQTQGVATQTLAPPLPKNEFIARMTIAETADQKDEKTQQVSRLKMVLRGVIEQGGAPIDLTHSMFYPRNSASDDKEKKQQQRNISEWRRAFVAILNISEDQLNTQGISGDPEQAFRGKTVWVHYTPAIDANSTKNWEKYADIKFLSEVEAPTELAKLQQRLAAANGATGGQANGAMGGMGGGAASMGGMGGGMTGLPTVGPTGALPNLGGPAGAAPAGNAFMAGLGAPAGGGFPSLPGTGTPPL